MGADARADLRDPGLPRDGEPLSELPVWLELHVDDELVARDLRRAAQSVSLLRRVASLAEERGARLSFRFRAPLAGSPEGRALIAALAARGHEIGVHAHGRGLAEAAAAVRASGVDAVVATPGLVQVGAAGRAALLEQAAGLGFRLVTDHGAARAWAYEGLLAREEAGLLVAAPAVRPTDWGLYAPDGERRPLDRAAVARLRALERAALERHGARFFGAALHEHDLVAPGTLAPLDASMDALVDYLDARVRPSALLLAEGPAPRAAPLAARPLSDARLRLVRAVGLATGLAARLPRPAPPALPGGARLPVGRRFIVVERHGPARPRALVLLSHAGREGGRRLGLRPFGLAPRDLADRGFALLLYDRAGTGGSPPDGPLTPGNPAHTEDFRAALALARAEGAPVLALSWSAGVLPVLRAAAGGARPDALLDAEGPADRWSLLPPFDDELRAWDVWEDARWEGREPARLLPALGLPYGRLQAERDHLHGACVEHGRRMVAAARAAGLPVWDPGLLAGALHGHPARALEGLEALLAVALAGAPGRD